MAENEKNGCTHDCSTCGHKCGESKDKKNEFLAEQNQFSNVKNVIAVMSGKGGVGKSMVTSLLAVSMRRKGYKVAILDGDITGPSIPKSFGVSGEVTGTDGMMFPLVSKTGIEMMSVNLLLDDPTKPVVWRGSVISGAVKQFWSDVVWNDVDFMFVDMPPGTGDVPLTVFQSLPVTGAVIVTSPQELVSMIVEKSVNMAKLMDIPVVGIVENMSGVICPDCGKRIDVFGESHTAEIAEKSGLEMIGQIPLDPKLTKLCDKGIIELFENDYLDKAADALEKLMGNAE
ncbi:MAG: Mrp/NBP35 family ATP-binding protein [Clostridia bacterium]|nr:Mrp/NBP35 family ATP-binding protein [Clostridia bacterium]MBQ1934705.1 Mrp/NBP35 family ATP-binding protein [Clostridia bacterium]